LNNDFTWVVIRRDVVPKFLDLILVEFTILVGVVVFEDPLGVFLDLVLGVAKWVILIIYRVRDRVWLGITLIVTLRIVICSVISLVVPLRIVICSVISLIVIVQWESTVGGDVLLQVEEGIAALGNSEVTGEQHGVLLDAALEVFNVGGLGAVVVLLVNDGQIGGSEPDPSVLSGVLHSMESLATSVVGIGNDALVLGVTIVVWPETVDSLGDGGSLGAAHALIAVDSPVDFFAPAVRIVLLLDAVGFPTLIVAVEAGIELDVVLDVSPWPQLLGSVAWEVVGGKFIEGGSGGSLELGDGRLGSGEGNSSRNH
jgi:hypothetical protein